MRFWDENFWQTIGDWLTELYSCSTDSWERWVAKQQCINQSNSITAVDDAEESVGRLGLWLVRPKVALQKWCFLSFFRIGKNNVFCIFCVFKKMQKTVFFAFFAFSKKCKNNVFFAFFAFSRNWENNVFCSFVQKAWLLFNLQTRAQSRFLSIPYKYCW